jgi:hypothetical protein
MILSLASMNPLINMHQTNNKKREYTIPVIIYAAWSGIFLFYIFLLIRVGRWSGSGNQQEILQVSAKVTGIAVKGYFVISILTSFLDFIWFRRFWYVNLLVFLVTGIFWMLSLN